MMQYGTPLAMLTFAAATALGCASSPSVEPTAERVVIEVSPDDTMADVARQAYAAAGVQGQQCTLVWGDVVTQPEEAREVRLVWADLEYIDGYVLCDEDMELVLRDPRAVHLAMLYYRDDGLHVGHPSRGGTSRLDRTPLSIRSDAPAPCLTVFDANSSQIDAPAYRVLRALREVPEDFLIGAWPMDRGQSGGGEAQGGEEAVAKP